MQHIHLKETESTQTVVKTYLSQGNTNILVSTDFQSGGVGRQGASWNHFEEALAFSFSLKPNEVLTLTPLEIGVLLAKFFKSGILLKWPNDLINPQREKIGGILCQLVGNNVVVGIGINLKGPSNNQDFDYPVGAIFDEGIELIEDFKRGLPLQIFNFIQSHRLKPNQVREEFIKLCVHQKQEVRIINGKEEIIGTFEGIADNGEALIKQANDEIKKVMTGSLRF